MRALPRPAFIVAMACLASLAPYPLNADAQGSPEQSGPAYGGTVAMFDTAPKLDGRIEPDEWTPALRMFGVQHRRGGDYLEDRKVASYVGFTKDRLYLAVVSELPPDQELVIDSRHRDGSMTKGDALDIWLDANHANRQAGAGDQRYYQTMVNASGAIYDKSYDPTKGSPDLGWNGNWRVAHRTHDTTSEASALQTDTGVWVFEGSIPFEDIGIEGSPIGKTIGVLIARIWRRPGGQQPWFPHSHAFAHWPQYPRITLMKDAPTVQVMDFGDQLFDGHLDMTARLINPGPARTVRVRAEATSSNMPAVSETKTLKLPAESTTSYTFTNKGRFHKDAEHRFNLAITDAERDTAHMRYSMQWRAPREPRWKVQTGPEPKKAVKLAYYPSYGFVRVFVDPTELGEKGRGVEQATVAIVNADGKRIAGGDMQWRSAPAEQRFEVGELAEGRYTAKITLKGYGETFERHFERKYFAWEGNGLGETNAVLPPFKPIEVSGDQVNVVMREHRVGGLGLWRSVRAASNDRGSGMKELLASPMALKVNDGEPLQGSGEFTKQADHEVVYEGRAEHAAVTVETKTITEFDGCMRVEMTLAPGSGDQPLDQLYLDIPIKDERAALFHCTTTGLRSNPAGAVPDGAGRVWDSRDLPDGNWYGNFHPYLWVGGAERGLSWFADNDRNWVLETGDASDEFAPCQELVRKDGVLHARIHFVQKPIELKEKRTIVFGLMASPAKPMPDNWRATFFGGESVGEAPAIKWIGAQYWGSPTIMYSKAPINYDYSILDKMQEVRLGGDMGRFMRYWKQRNLTGDISDDTYMNRDKLARLAQASIRIASRLGDDYFTVYWEEFHRTLGYHEDVRLFQQEWTGRYNGSTNHNYPPSYLDYAVYQASQLIRRGIGTYFDNTFPKRGTDPVTTDAYELPSGRIQPSANMWRHREYLKRIWRLHHRMGPDNTPPIMMLHMTNTHIVPYMVFNHSNLDLEWFYGPEPAQTKYAPDLLRAESLGLQTGNYPCALARVRGPGSKDKSEAALEKARRTRTGVLMVHEIRGAGLGARSALIKPMAAFGYGSPDCRVTNYWDDEAPLRVEDDRVKWLLMRRDGKLMMLLVTWRPNPATATIQLDAKRLDVSTGTAVDVESGESLPLRDGTLEVPMDKYGVRLIRIE